MLSTLKGAAGGMGFVAREFALNLAQGVYEPDLVEHVPGIVNTVADTLSRRRDPEHSSTWTVPEHLNHADWVYTPRRVGSWRKTIFAPGAA